MRVSSIDTSIMDECGGRHRLNELDEDKYRNETTSHEVTNTQAILQDSTFYNYLHIAGKMQEAQNTIMLQSSFVSASYM